MSQYVAQPFVAGTPEAEVIGQTMIAFSENLQADIIKPILDKHGLTEISADKWYPHQLWMDILKEMNDTMAGGASSAFVAFGREVVQKAAMPDAIQTIPDALNALHAIHHANLRNIPAEEGYSIEVVAEQHYIVYHNTPNPEDAIYGFLWGMAARFKKPHETFVVRMIDNPAPEKARSAYEIKWGMQ
ncbi:MAG: hypothetical protein GFH27_549375n21 [Chloroflexi bacterium AL-W]|nr:hypothetical protein [Chloroflexi bacterium AL-W]